MTRRQRRRAPVRGTLFVIAGLLVTSGMIRVTDGAGQALARATETDAASAVTRTQTDADQTCEPAPDIAAVLAAFQQREARLASREAALQDRLAALRIADEEVSAKLIRLEAAEASLAQTIALAENASENDLDRLTKVYESMKPKQAAALFEEMDPNFAAGFLGRMRPEAAAAIMAGLSPEAAHLFSVVLAGRNADVPRQ